MPKIATCNLKSTAPISFGKPVPEKNHDETDAKYQERIWKERLHTNGQMIVIPGVMLKKALDEAAAHLGLKIPSRRGKTFKQSFLSGVRVSKDIDIGVDKDDDKVVQCEKVFVPARGIKGEAHRVWRWFPTIGKWSGNAEIIILDDKIDDGTLQKHLVAAGQFIGFGRYRAANGGVYGTFEVTDLKVETVGKKSDNKAEKTKKKNNID